MFQKFKNSRGMTLIEILIVLGIIAGAMAGIMMGVFKSSDKARVKQAMGEIERMSGFVKVYKQDKGDYPTGDLGLQALVDEGFIDEVPQDPWKHDYSYESPGSHGNKFEICSQGPDEDVETDDICSWKKAE